MNVNFYKPCLFTTKSMAVLSFIPYYMNPDCGERLGFGITLVLAILTTDVVLIDLVPRCSEVLVMDFITRLSLIFCFLSLMESALVRRHKPKH